MRNSHWGQLRQHDHERGLQFSRRSKKTKFFVMLDILFGQKPSISGHHNKQHRVIIITELPKQGGNDQRHVQLPIPSKVTNHQKTLLNQKAIHLNTFKPNELQTKPQRLRPYQVRPRVPNRKHPIVGVQYRQQIAQYLRWYQAL